MPRSPTQLRHDALAIWRAAVAAVDSRRLVCENVSVANNQLRIVDESFPLDSIRHLVVVGAGKAGAGMANGLEDALGDEWIARTQLSGWVNVPADCVRKLHKIHLHAARPAGVNEPTSEGVAGTEAILQLVGSADPDDLCVCLLSGGGSALLPAPVAGITLEDKQQVTKLLSSRGANIAELNCVRKQLSRVKGGRLARACGARRLVTLVISDVIGDPLETIASGPTVEDTTTPRDALQVLERFGGLRSGFPRRVFDVLQQALLTGGKKAPLPALLSHHLIGNNAVAVDAAGVEAERRGYSHAMTAARSLEGTAEDVGHHLASLAMSMRDQRGPDCLITGGEPVVKLVEPERRGLGGRNQQLVLAAYDWLLAGTASSANPLDGLCVLSGGTDGEDGPTDAAGAYIDAMAAEKCRQLGLAPTEFLGRNDAYHFFQQLGTLLVTGPTHTNVCDVRVVTVRRHEEQAR